MDDMANMLSISSLGLLEEGISRAEITRELETLFL